MAESLDESMGLGEILHQMGDLSHDLFCTADVARATFLWLSPNWARSLGWTLEELRAQPFLEFVHPDDLEHNQR